MKKIGFLGPRGTFSHEALEKYAQNIGPYEAVDFSSISELIDAVNDNRIDEAVAPMENSIEGAVNATLDILSGDMELKIKAEIVIPIEQNLLVRKGTDIKDIRRILSHPQPIGQCRKYIEKNFPGVQVEFVYSTAGAALEVAGGAEGAAAIGSLTAARVYGLEVAARNIQDESNNFTRFVIIAKEDSKPTGCDKTSLVFSTENKPGSLYRVLQIFNLWDINMTRIESRPARDRLGSYKFFVDIEGHWQDPDVRDAITMVRRKTSYFKNLGSYPAHRYPYTDSPVQCSCIVGECGEKSEEGRSPGERG